MTLGSLTRPSAVRTTAVAAGASASCCSLSCGITAGPPWPPAPARRAGAVEEQRVPRDARALHQVARDLPRHREAQDRRVDGAPGLVVVRVARRGHAEERRRLARGEIDEPLRDALHALRELVFSAPE